jgi:hypothetical protein
MYTGYLAARVNMTVAYYLLPAVPPLILLATNELTKWAVLISGRWRLSAGWIHGLLAILFVLTATPPGLQKALLHRQAAFQPLDQNPQFQAGQWLLAHASPNSRILHDRPIFVPPVFQNVQAMSTTTLAQLAEFDPDFVLTCQGTARQYADSAQASLYFNGPAAFMERYEYYRALPENRTSYALVADLNGIVQIYQRRKNVDP